MFKSTKKNINPRLNYKTPNFHSASRYYFLHFTTKITRSDVWNKDIIRYVRLFVWIFIKLIVDKTLFVNSWQKNDIHKSFWGIETFTTNTRIFCNVLFRKVYVHFLLKPLAFVIEIELTFIFSNDANVYSKKFNIHNSEFWILHL